LLLLDFIAHFDGDLDDCNILEVADVRHFDFDGFAHYIALQ
jgi:hypothetical protein